MNEDLRSGADRYPSPCVPDGLVLETPGIQGDTPLCHVDFVVAQK